ncbi:MAG: FG-GAP-like repeat-containing protein [Candidatus Cloacimonetes bacterium]|nr:FG-GAP-like repeat-containing protein [Candidatus Cloacimonadota bacterium]
MNIRPCLQAILLLSFIFPVMLMGNAMFEEATIIEDTNGACALASADFNLDGWADIVYTCNPGHHIKWLENNGGLDFTPHMIIEGFTNAKAIDVCDINQDGYPDFVATAKGADKISWFENDHSGSFIEHEITSSWDEPGFVQVKDHLSGQFVDINSDGEVDILATACTSGRLGWFENDGEENFTEHIIKDGWTIVSGAAAIDLDGDGYCDILAAAQGGGICWLENIGDDEEFVEHQLFNEWDKPNWIQAGYINDDEYLDFAATSCGSSDAVGWFENDGNQNFSLHLLRDNYNGARCPVLSDIDEDGDMDIFSIAWQTGIATFFENEGEENYREWTISNDAVDLLKLFVVNLDNDADLDIIGCTAVYGVHHIRWWESLDNFLLCDFESDIQTGHAPLGVSFIPEIYSKPEVFSYCWDFNNDGIMDSTIPAPEYEYLLPASYDVHLSVTNGYTVEDALREDYIRVFDGESALLFTAGSNHVSIPAVEAINLTEAFTFEGWIKADAYGYNPVTGMGRIMDKTNVTLFLSQSYPLYNSNCLVVKMIHADGTVSFVSTPDNSIVLHEGTHIAVSYAGELKVYLNGIEQILTYHTAPSGAVADNSTQALIIGNITTTNAAFTGIIDEVRVWDMVRSQQEIMANMTQYLNGTESGLAGYWQFNEGNGDQTFDLTQTCPDGAICNCSWVQGTPFDLTAANQEDILSPQISQLTIFPNPFNPQTCVNFHLAEAGKVELTVYNLKGQQIRKLISANLSEGEHSIIWNGVDEAGKGVSSGIYLFCMETVEQRIFQKALLLK